MRPILTYEETLTFTRQDRPKKRVLIARDVSMETPMPTLPVSNEYELPESVFHALQSVWTYAYEEPVITMLDQKVASYGRPQSPA